MNEIKNNKNNLNLIDTFLVILRLIYQIKINDFYEPNKIIINNSYISEKINNCNSNSGCNCNIF